jgi:hypothetical protein
LEGAVERSDDQHLNWEERWARDRLECVYGRLRVIDRKGRPPKLHDLEADLPGGEIAAIEITSEVEEARLSLAASADRHLSALKLPGSGNVWQVGLSAHARVNAIRRADLLKLLGDMERQGRQRALNIGDYRDPFVARLRAFHIESVYCFKAKPGHEGTVRVAAGFYGGREWDQGGIDAWLDEFLVSSRGRNKLAKPTRAVRATERHLVIVLEPFSGAGMGISLGLSDREEEGAADDAIPSIVPPEPLTHVWLMPLMGRGEVLYWARHSGWAVTKPEEMASRASSDA